MTIWAIIPVKALARAKSRLSSVLTPEQRQQFAEAMFRHVLQTVRSVPQVTGTLVISRDTKALAIAREQGVNTVQESGAPELNAALMRATQIVARWKTSAVLILPADVPLISREDVTSIVQMGPDEPTVVIATDQREDGTNALFIRPPGLFPYSFGVGSFQRHIAMARQAGAEVKVYHSDRLMLDIDVPEDLQKYQHLVQQNGQVAVPLILTPDKAT